MRICLLLLSFWLVGTLQARDVHPIQQGTAAALGYCTATHDVGKMSLLLTNGGTIGMGEWPAENSFVSPYTGDLSGCHLGRVIYGSNWWGAEYPLGSGMKVLHAGALWVGGITETGDTLVSTGFLLHERPDLLAPTLELHPSEGIDGEISVTSLLDPVTSIRARSDQDYTITYTDTMTRGVPGLDQDYVARRWHRPLGIKVTQRSSQWSNPLCDDFVLLEYTLENIGNQSLRDVYAGLYLVLAFGHIGAIQPDWVVPYANVCGKLDTFRTASGCGFLDTLGMIWMTDNSGGVYDESTFVASGPQQAHRSATAMKTLWAPREADNPSFNWWTPYWPTFQQYDYGPRHKVPTGTLPRSFDQAGTGTPVGDANKYYLMSNGEFDPDVDRIQQIGPEDPVWEYPSDTARLIGHWGDEMNCLLSVGPMQLARGEVKSFVVAYVGGEKFHNDPTNWMRLRDGDVDGWYANVDFAPLVKNFRQAMWTFDNPGYDTDGDGYAGKFHVCVLDSELIDGVWVAKVADTTYYEGDGVPDWRAVGPPPAPKVWLTSTLNGIKIRFNGQQSETTKDLVSGRIDFEGYNVYVGRDDREASFSLTASYDAENYDKYVLKAGEWIVGDIPFTLEHLRCLYGQGASRCADSSFDPLTFTAAHPYRHRNFADSVFFFQKHGYNASQWGLSSTITRTYPDEPKPIAGDTLPPEAYTSDGYLKYYEYECTLTGLLPTVPYFINVTAFDYGDPASGVEALESSKLVNLQSAYPLADRNQLSDSLAPVYIYPNPYYSDGRYAAGGYEDRHLNGANPDRNRLIHFVNVPASCIIRIYTLDGDLVRAIKHDYDPSDPNSHHETWDMINRNIQTVVSGLYYWTVEGADGKVQIGKLVIIR